MPRFFLLCLTPIVVSFCALFSTDRNISLELIATIPNPCPQYSLIHSVDCHPIKKLFCVTYPSDNRVMIYEYEDAYRPTVFQSLQNPSACLNAPSHALFSSDGKKMIVINWMDRIITIHCEQGNGLYSEVTNAVISPPSSLADLHPHGMALSPCGNFLAIAYGWSNSSTRAIALFYLNDLLGCELRDCLYTQDLDGTPKGVTFTPDEKCLAVTFSDLNALMIYSIDDETHTIHREPKQVVAGPATGMLRPEGVKISPDGRHCAVTNSELCTITFYPFDPMQNRVTQDVPEYTLQSGLSFPHGIDFSPNGSYFIVTDFGPIGTTANGSLDMKHLPQPSQSKINIYLLRH